MLIRGAVVIGMQNVSIGERNVDVKEVFMVMERKVAKERLNQNFKFILYHYRTFNVLLGPSNSRKHSFQELFLVTRWRKREFWRSSVLC